MQTKLSFLQRVILEALLEMHIEGKKRDATFALAQPNMRALHDETENWGVRWMPSKIFEDFDRAVSADISRAVARLEKRGLVIRQNQITGAPDGDNPFGCCRKSHHSTPPIRCTHVLLTPEGRAIAIELQNHQPSNG